MMRWCLLPALLSSTALASPSVAVVNSCLQTRVQVGVISTEIPNQEILKEDNYKLGYDAEYLVFEGKDVGFAIGKKGGAMLFDGKLWPTKFVVVLPGAEKIGKPNIHVELANWSMLQEGGNKYLCAVDNFDGLGRSGNFQTYRYAYILRINHHKKLFLAVGKSK
jgi:hypothetical protein